jgi:hypothetical protein
LLFIFYTFLFIYYLKGNVRWIEFSVLNTTLYGSFLNYALVDEVQKPKQLVGTTSGALLSFVLPHFWVHAVIDPGEFSPIFRFFVFLFFLSLEFAEKRKTKTKNEKRKTKNESPYQPSS